MAIEEGNLFFLILLLVPLLCLILKHLKPSSTPPLPPGPFQWPVLGNILQLGNKPHISLTHFARIYGSVFSLKLGTQLVVVGSTREAAMEILKTRDRTLSGRYVPHLAPTKSPQLNKLSLGWIVECNDKWKYLRTICRTELFSSKALESQKSKREKKILEMVAFIKKMEGKELEVRKVAVITVFNMLSSIMVSEDLMSLDQENADGEMTSLLHSILELASTPNISDLYPILGRFDLQGLQKKIMELHERCFEICEAITEERRQGKRMDASRGSDFLDTLINNGSSNQQINVLLLELLSAGTDTSSNTIEWTMAELMKNPKCMKKVQEEITRNLIPDILKESPISNLTYLQACVKETLRLHPPGPFLLPHRATDTCQVMNYTIPKNSQVLVNFWAIGRDPKYWKDPLIFKPERFLNSNLDYKGNDFEFIPFGSGRRICPGLPMAAKQVPLIVASLIHFFDWSLPGGKDSIDLDMTEKYGLTLRMEKPLLLIPKIKLRNKREMA
ncbi:(S)-N-methylcoclaurine 3'-hydroxylase isozyme 1 [Ricinus communis]|uniref:(S)-N-methylcoclaurine 3'-hydroxylase isozyme, putative n=1 Tax=Ricinus communis TaxID=3988 RepID=B9RC29_RICCO|nr:(S)-N-methylcoclaurine 3'-hydroxylase isozyme 1 [Ricinus communis]EEF51100.1 (S)-N-methylcoclaurine 3'-hydroxylase isozyme, putative [Ricinus communis]|eukprot:XP_002509713.1 (S)-N-methylcoclaurine 3'-hydroxylase isozyme 1 [Ricinus communis]